MKTLQTWLDEYGDSHQNRTNKTIHYICVPLIYYSIVGLLMSIPLGPLKNIDQVYHVNWAIITLIPVLFFYLRLSPKMAFAILIYSITCIFINHQISFISEIELWLISLIIFVIAWVFQFYGHKIEGKKPSFFKDIQFLLIGPAWIINSLIFNQNKTSNK